MGMGKLGFRSYISDLSAIAMDGMANKIYIEGFCFNKNTYTSVGGAGVSWILLLYLYRKKTFFSYTFSKYITASRFEDRKPGTVV